MKLNAPKQITWTIAVVLGLAGFLGDVVPIGAVAPYSFWLLSVAFVLLALGTMIKDL